MPQKGVSKFASHLVACSKTQDCETGTRLTGKVVSSTGDGIYIEFENNGKGILPGYLCVNYKLGQDVEVVVLWQDSVTKLLHLQPANIFLEFQNGINIMLPIIICGSNMTCRLL